MRYFELFFWLSALFLLAIANPNEHHFSLCPIAALGFDWCPGCGLGRSITALFQGDLAASFRYHWLGIPALFVLLHRIYQLINSPYIHSFINQTKGEQHHV